MNLNSTILLITLSVGFHAGIMGMELKKQYFLVAKTESGKQAYSVKKLACEVVKFNSVSKIRDQIEEIGTWLTQKRGNISDKAWGGLVHEFVSDIDKLQPFCANQIEKEKLFLIKSMIMTVASELKSGQDCSKLLLQLAQDSEYWTKRAKY